MLRGETPRVFPGFVVDFVNSCEEFRSIAAHVACYAEKHAWGALEADSLQSWLPELTRSRLLISTADLLAACAAHAAPAPPPIQTIGFPTGGDRSDLVARALGSFAENARIHGRRVDFLVADSSADPRHRAAFREASREQAKSHGVRVRYAGDEEKRRLAAKLIRRGIAPDVIEFALFDPLGIGFACGANRNALLLHEAGRMFCSVDDDVICKLASAPPTAARLKLFSSCDPFTRWLFADREAAIQHAGSVDADFLASHETLLGRGLAELCAGVDPRSLDASQIGDDFLRRAWTGGGLVRASFSGHLGDPGIPTSTYYLFYEGENRRRFTADEAGYRAALAARSVFALAPCTAIGDASTSPGMAMGLDHRELLPPFFPVLHAEDFTYGATLWQTVPGAFLGHAPLAVRHEPRPGKTILQPSDLGPERRAVVFEFSHLIRRIILRHHRHETAAPADRMRHLGRHLVTLGTQSAADFADYLATQVLEMESEKLCDLEEMLRENSAAPEWWRADLDRYLLHVRSALMHDDFDIPFDLKCRGKAEDVRGLIRALLSRYGALLEAWPDLVAAATEIDAAIEWMPAV